MTIPAVSVDGVSAAQVAAGAPLRLKKEHFKITICKPVAGSRTQSRQCVKVHAVGRKATPKHGLVVAELERNGKVYARERHRPGGIKLVQVRDITPGKYRLVLHEKTKRYVVRNKRGKRLHSVSHEFNTYVPLTIKWSRKL